MTVFEMVEYLLDGCEVAVYDYATEEEIFFGYYTDIPDAIGELECLNIDPQTRKGRGAIICLNVDTRE